VIDLDEMSYMISGAIAVAGGVVLVSDAIAG